MMVAVQKIQKTPELSVSIETDKPKAAKVRRASQAEPKKSALKVKALVPLTVLKDPSKTLPPLQPKTKKVAVVGTHPDRGHTSTTLSKTKPPPRVKTVKQENALFALRTERDLVPLGTVKVAKRGRPRKIKEGAVNTLLSTAAMLFNAKDKQLGLKGAKLNTTTLLEVPLVAKTQKPKPSARSPGLSIPSTGLRTVIQQPQVLWPFPSMLRKAAMQG